MSRLFDDALNQYLCRNSAVVSGYPFTMACCFNSNDDASIQALLFVGDKDSDVQYHAMLANGAAGGDPICANSRDAGGDCNAVTTTGYSPNMWHHACALFIAPNDRRAYIDGGSEGFNDTSRTPVGIDRVAVGVLGRSVLGWYMSGRIAEAAIWNIDLSVDEIKSLAGGVSPLKVRRQNLRAYYPLVRDDDLDRWKYGYHLDDFNNPTVGEHPRLILPSALQLGSPAGISPCLLRAIEKY